MLVLVTSAIVPSLALSAEAERYFAIQVVDEETGRGVPLVELETIHHLCYVTDSNGLVAISDPDLMGQKVFFTIRSHGYEYPKDGFGFRGKAFEVEPGGKGVVKIRRINLAERLYRATGSGIYRDTVLLGQQAPIEHPLLHAQVVGCDSVMSELYRGKIYWFWGDTSRPHYPIGANFHISGATSPLPNDGGLDPSVGVNFDYFTGEDGSVRATAEMAGEGPTWISAVTVLPDADGQERMYAGYVKIRNQLEPYAWGFVVWNDETQRFEQIKRFDERPRIFLEPQAHSFLHQVDGTQYVYFANPLPLTRVKADPAAFVDPQRYEGFTCLKAGTRPEDGELDRDSAGRLRYTWKVNTPPLTQKDQAMLVESGVMKPEERRIALQDVESGREVQAHSGSVYWNPYRRRWVLIAVELGGEESFLGEVWFAEADRPTGPWRYARKVASHDQYTFYNPKQHPFFAQDDGRTIFFEGTYTYTFSGVENPSPTPRYDYNQVMYRLDLSLPALQLPVPFYDARGTEHRVPFAAKLTDRDVAFFALESAGEDTVPVCWTGSALQVRRATDEGDSVLFHALPHDFESPPATTTPLYEFVHQESGERVYSTDAEASRPGYRRSAEPVCRVWKAGA